MGACGTARGTGGQGPEIVRAMVLVHLWGDEVINETQVPKDLDLERRTGRRSARTGADSDLPGSFLRTRGLGWSHRQMSVGTRRTRNQWRWHEAEDGTRIQRRARV